jgi:predicted nucleic acid-binding protein
VNLVVDTSVWSLILRRDSVDEKNPFVRAFRRCVKDGHGLVLLGPILQELLDGVVSVKSFSHLQSALESIPLAALQRSTYILASSMRNDCRKAGIQAGATDFLIAAACVELGYPLLTADRDFERIAGCTRLILVRCV